MIFLDLNPESFGLDISDSSFKIAKLKKKGRFLSLASFGEFELKPGTVEKGNLKNEKDLVERIKEALKNIRGKKLKTKRVVFSLPEEMAFLKVIQVPEMKDSELKTAIPFEAENYIPMPIEDVYLDFQKILPIKNHLNHIDVLIVAYPKNVVDAYISAIKKAGLIPSAIEIESQSQARSLIKGGVSPFPVMIVDFGRDRSGFAIYSGYSIRFTSSSPVSSQHLTESISRSLKITMNEADKLKTKYGLKINNNNDGKALFNAMVPALTDLCEQIKRCISYYETHSGHEHLAPSSKKGIEKVIFCGRGANLKGFAEFFSSELMIPCEIGNPWVNILPEPLREVPGLSFEESLGYSAALGLAIRGIKNQ